MSRILQWERLNFSGAAGWLKSMEWIVKGQRWKVMRHLEEVG